MINTPEAQLEIAAWNSHRARQRGAVTAKSGPAKIRLIDGHTLAQWAAYFVQQDAARIDTAIRTGLISGLDNMEIARKVIGSLRLHGVDGVTEITRQHISHLARTAIKPRKARSAALKPLSK